MRTDCAAVLRNVPHSKREAVSRDLAEGYRPSAVAQRRDVSLAVVLELRARLNSRRAAATLLARAASR